MSTTHSRHKALVRRANDGLNEQSEAAFRRDHADDVVIHDGEETVRGIDAALEREAAIWRAFPDLHHTLAAVIAEGDTVAYRFTAVGTHEGAFRTVDPTGRRVTVTGQAMVRVADDELAEVWLNYDVLGLLRQVGAVPEP